MKVTFILMVLYRTQISYLKQPSSASVYGTYEMISYAAALLCGASSALTFIKEIRINKQLLYSVNREGFDDIFMIP